MRTAKIATLMFAVAALPLAACGEKRTDTVTTSTTTTDTVTGAGTMSDTTMGGGMTSDTMAVPTDTTTMPADGTMPTDGTMAPDASMSTTSSTMPQ